MNPQRDRGDALERLRELPAEMARSAPREFRTPSGSSRAAPVEACHDQELPEEGGGEGEGRRARRAHALRVRPEGSFSGSLRTTGIATSASIAAVGISHRSTTSSRRPGRTIEGSFTSGSGRSARVRLRIGDLLPAKSKGEPHCWWWVETATSAACKIGCDGRRSRRESPRHRIDLRPVQRPRLREPRGAAGAPHPPRPTRFVDVDDLTFGNEHTTRTVLAVWSLEAFAQADRG